MTIFFILIHTYPEKGKYRSSKLRPVKKFEKWKDVFALKKLRQKMKFLPLKRKTNEMPTNFEQHIPAFLGFGGLWERGAPATEPPCAHLYICVHTCRLKGPCKGPKQRALQRAAFEEKKSFILRFNEQCFERSNEVNHHIRTHQRIPSIWISHTSYIP